MEVDEEVKAPPAPEPIKKKKSKKSKKSAKKNDGFAAMLEGKLNLGFVRDSMQKGQMNPYLARKKKK